MRKNARHARRAAAHSVCAASASLQSFLRGKTPLVDRRSLAALQDDLTQTRTGMDRERALRDVADLEHLAVGHARADEAGRDVDHEPEPREARATFEPAADVA